MNDSEKLWYISRMFEEADFLTEFFDLQIHITLQGTEHTLFSAPFRKLKYFVIAPKGFEEFIMAEKKAINIALLPSDAELSQESAGSFLIPLLKGLSRLEYYIWTGDKGEWQKFLRFIFYVTPKFSVELDFVLTPRWKSPVPSEKARKILAYIEHMGWGPVPEKKI